MMPDRAALPLEEGILRARVSPNGGTPALATEGLPHARVRKTKKPPRGVAFLRDSWSGKEDSNLRPLRPERSALPG